VFCEFRRELYRIHVQRLEADNAELSAVATAAETKAQQAQREAEELRAKLEALQIALDKKTMEVAEQEKQIVELETRLEATQDELVETRQRSTGGFLERVVRFLTCSTTTSTPPVSAIPVTPQFQPTTSFIGSKQPPARESTSLSLKGLWKIQAAPSEARVLSSDTVLQPLKLQKHQDTPDDNDEEDTVWCEGFTRRTSDAALEEAALRARESDPLFQVSKFCF
jgi:hypothetical protein